MNITAQVACRKTRPNDINEISASFYCGCRLFPIRPRCAFPATARSFSAIHQAGDRTRGGAEQFTRSATMWVCVSLCVVRLFTSLSESRSSIESAVSLEHATSERATMQAVRPRTGATPLLLFFCFPPKTTRRPPLPARRSLKTRPLRSLQAGSGCCFLLLLLFPLRCTSEASDNRWV